MQQLEQCWTSGASIGSAIGTMFTLQGNGMQLIQKDSVTPQFVFQGKTVRSHA
jgi:hypothetical protein